LTVKSRTVYTVAFRGDEFLMVYNPKRGGWEMPGGKLNGGEATQEAAKREYEEESGFAVEIVATRDLGHCEVCAGRVLGKVSEGYEMESRLFSDIPEDLAFDRAEYEEVVPWAREAVSRR
jgi:8-oxo-dGTP diphosphatase